MGGIEVMNWDMMYRTVGNFILTGGLLLAISMFAVYMIGLLIHFINGNDFNTTDTFDPFKNNHVGVALLTPFLIFGATLLVAITWPVSVPVLFIVLVTLPFRLRNLSKKKMWKELKS